MARIAYIQTDHRIRTQVLLAVTVLALAAIAGWGLGQRDVYARWLFREITRSDLDAARASTERALAAGGISSDMLERIERFLDVFESTTPKPDIEEEGNDDKPHLRNSCLRRAGP